jgi:hypothetical protein
MDHLTTHVEVVQRHHDSGRARVGEIDQAWRKILEVMHMDQVWRYFIEHASQEWLDSRVAVEAGVERRFAPYQPIDALPVIALLDLEREARLRPHGQARHDRDVVPSRAQFPC